ncbi:MAG: hypothetical protein WBG66_13410 [Geitlerinemataceae cyanobacterium]
MDRYSDRDSVILTKNSSSLTSSSIGFPFAAAPAMAIPWEKVQKNVPPGIWVLFEQPSSIAHH